MAAAPPFVGPSARHCTTRALFERGAHMHRGDRGLPLGAFTDAVGPGFCEQQRLLSGNVLKPGEIRAKLRFAVQVDVEGTNVEEGKVEELGRRKIDVSEKA